MEGNSDSERILQAAETSSMRILMKSIYYHSILNESKIRFNRRMSVISFDSNISQLDGT